MTHFLITDLLLSKEQKIVWLRADVSMYAWVREGVISTSADGSALTQFDSLDATELIAHAELDPHWHQHYSPPRLRAWWLWHGSESEGIGEVADGCPYGGLPVCPRSIRVGQLSSAPDPEFVANPAAAAAARQAALDYWREYEAEQSAKRQRLQAANQRKLEAARAARSAYKADADD